MRYCRLALPEAPAEHGMGLSVVRQSVASKLWQLFRRELGADK